MFKAEQIAKAIAEGVYRKHRRCAAAWGCERTVSRPGNALCAVCRRISREARRDGFPAAWQNYAQRTTVQP